MTGASPAHRISARGMPPDVLDADGGNLPAFLHPLQEEFPETLETVLDAVRQVAPFFGTFVLRPDPRNADRGGGGALGRGVRHGRDLGEEPGREAGKRAFAEFEAGRNLTANQIEFLGMVIDHLTERGTVEPGALYESQFTDLNPLGIDGVFGPERAAEVIHVLEAVRRRAAA
ncbi:hypothetical protein JL100_022870 [Skermanella mucosa]|uniref:type I restriction-modification enzyme R subunit C-terminal domain-containing protein n=1 Tax=Skermanella mucosa TaxID=1789672 RepID=UPI00192CAC53|nr:type I restriction-modification enzyme R subunit C-terminal domain-containing protein [Skermanella mucosa]UEM19898.1 hypothetical protein JL100_022870 [Skermanella mucosa]